MTFEGKFGSDTERIRTCVTFPNTPRKVGYVKEDQQTIYAPFFRDGRALFDIALCETCKGGKWKYCNCGAL